MTRKSGNNEDEATSVVFGMPHEAIRQGGVDKVLPLERLAGEVVKATFHHS